MQPKGFRGKHGIYPSFLPACASIQYVFGVSAVLLQGEEGRYGRPEYFD